MRLLTPDSYLGQQVLGVMTEGEADHLLALELCTPQELPPLVCLQVIHYQEWTVAIPGSQAYSPHT